jgi:hypothetical protein
MVSTGDRFDFVELLGCYLEGFEVSLLEYGIEMRKRQAKFLSDGHIEYGKRVAFVSIFYYLGQFGV